MVDEETDKRPHVVVVGAGFAGLEAAKALGREKFRVTLIDRTNHHLFQPLLYQVATAGLSPSDIASPIRGVLSGFDNITVWLDEVTGFELEHKKLETRTRSVSYDYLLLATGMTNNYFGHDEWAHFAPGLKSLDDAVELRRRVLLAFEDAEHEPDEERQRQLLTFVVIGGGATGVEMAGAMSELAKHVLASDFRHIKTEMSRVLLVEGGPEVLANFGHQLSDRALTQLKEMGVETRLGTKVTNINAEGVQLGDEFVPTRTVVWAAGVRATGLTAKLGVPLDRVGRVLVEEDCSVPGHPEVFVLGDAALFTHTPDKKPLPGVSPVAMQQARHTVKNLTRERYGQSRKKFVYFDKGSMATIGRSRAVAQAGRIEMSGFLAWVAWLLVHIWYLIGFRNRVVVLFGWFWSYLIYGRGARLITGARIASGAPAVEPPSFSNPATLPADPPTAAAVEAATAVR